MADIDTDPFGEHKSRSDDHTDTGENIPLIPRGPEGRPTWDPSGVPGPLDPWEPECEQETSFGGESQTSKLMKDYVKDLYKRISGSIGEIPEPSHYDYFKLEDREPY